MNTDSGQNVAVSVVAVSVCGRYDLLPWIHTNPSVNPGRTSLPLGVNTIHLGNMIFS